MTVLTPANAFPNLAFPQHLTGQTKTVQSFTYPGAVWPKATGPAVLSYGNAFFNRNTFSRNQVFDRDYMLATGVTNLNTFSGVTLSAWVTIIGASGGNLWIVGDGLGFHAYLLITTTPGHISYTGLTGSANVAVGQVHHVAVTSPNGTGTTIGYLDGVVDASGAAAAFSSVTSWYCFNLDASQGNDPLRGAVSDVALWSTVLTPTQIAQLAAGQRANTVGANANLVGYWPITGASPETDFSGNGFNMVLGSQTTTYSPGPVLISGPAQLQSLNGGIVFPQHLTGQTNTVRNFLYPGAVQPIFIPPPTPILFAQILM
jgi:hypothetical protein